MGSCVIVISNYESVWVNDLLRLRPGIASDLCLVSSSLNVDYQLILTKNCPLRKRASDWCDKQTEIMHTSLEW